MNENKILERFELVAWSSIIKVSKSLDEDQYFGNIYGTIRKFLTEKKLSAGQVIISGSAGLVIGVTTGYVISLIK